LQDGHLLLFATLKKGSGVNDRNDQGVWSWTPEGMRLQIREGVTQVTTPTGAKTIKSIAILPSVSGSLAQGRSHATRRAGSPALTARVTIADKTQAILEDDGAGNFRLGALAANRMPVNTYTGDPALANAQWDTFGFPGWSMDGSRLGFRANMRAIDGTNLKGSALFVDGADGRLSFRVRKGDPAPISSASPIEGATFTSFKDPVIGGSPMEYAFIGKLAGKGITSANDEGLWMGTNEGPRLVAREGQLLGDATLPSARWKSFRSLALGSARGPLFVADLDTGVVGLAKTTERRLWGMYSSGMLLELLREGGWLGSGTSRRMVKRFDALVPANGAEGTLRGLSPSGARIVINAEMSDGSRALVQVEMP
jgi:hypothetical protein